LAKVVANWVPVHYQQPTAFSLGDLVVIFREILLVL